MAAKKKAKRYQFSAPSITKGVKLEPNWDADLASYKPSFTFGRAAISQSIIPIDFGNNKATLTIGNELLPSVTSVLVQNWLWNKASHPKASRSRKTGNFMVRNIDFDTTLQTDVHRHLLNGEKSDCDDDIKVHVAMKWLKNKKAKDADGWLEIWQEKLDELATKKSLSANQKVRLQANWKAGFTKWEQWLDDIIDNDSGDMDDEICSSTASTTPSIEPTYTDSSASTPSPNELNDNNTSTSMPPPMVPLAPPSPRPRSHSTPVLTASTSTKQRSTRTSGQKRKLRQV